MASVKIIHAGKIHKLSRLPDSLSSLQESIKLVLQENLPKSYITQYEDYEGDNVMLATEEDFKAMILSEVSQNAPKSLRIHVISKDDSKKVVYNESENKDINEQIMEGSVTSAKESMNVKSKNKVDEGEEELESSDEEEKEDRIRDDFGYNMKERKHKSGGDEKDEMKRQKKLMKKELKVQRHARKIGMLKDAITEALFDNLPTIAKVVKAYTQDPNMNLEETVQNVRPKTSLAMLSEDKESLQASFKKPFLMFRSLIDVYKSLTDEQKTETNKVLGGIPEKFLTNDADKEKIKDQGWGHKHKRGDWGPDNTKYEGQDGRSSHKHYKGYEKREKRENKYEDQEGWRRKGKDTREGWSGGYEDKKKDWRAKGENEVMGSEFNIDLVKEVGSVPPSTLR